MLRRFFYLTIMYSVITGISGLKVGHYTDKKTVTDCTVILCRSETIANVDVRGPTAVWLVSTAIARAFL